MHGFLTFNTNMVSNEAPPTRDPITLTDLLPK